MSIINKMLQELDRRQGTVDPDAMLAMSNVRTVSPQRKDREWFWRIIAFLMVVAVAWVGWIAWQLQPREAIVTEQAFRAAENAQRRPAPVALAKAPEYKPTAESPPAEKAPPLQPAPETLKLASQIEKPVSEAPARAAAKEPPKQAAKEPVKTAIKQAAAPQAEAASPPVAPPAVAQAAPKVEKRDRVRSPEDRAEAEFRRGAALLNQGRVPEAEESFRAALASHAGHEAARQALIALSLEQRRIDEARQLLREGLALNPGNVRFAAVLARILIERKDYSAALDATSAVREAGDPELQMMRGTALQKMARHDEASEAFRAALRGAPQSGAAWMALGLSLEAQGKRSEAADAFKRAAAAGNLAVEARDYAEQKARQLQ